MFVKRMFPFFLLFLILWLFTISWTLFFTTCLAEDTPSDKETTPTYVGVAVCGKCHIKKEVGNQYEVWLGTKHARTWVMLQSSNAKKVAENAGVKGNPQNSVQCLKCHAPVEEGFKPAPTFHIEDGVQCEVCHGPASQHVAMKMDKETTVKVQLKRLTKEDCMICHNEKPSHEILKEYFPFLSVSYDQTFLFKRKVWFDYEKGWKKITHPLPTEGKK